VEEISGRHLFHKRTGEDASLPGDAFLGIERRTNMDVARLNATTTATAIGNKDVPRGRASETGKSSEVETRKAAPPQPDKKEVRAALDRIIRNTRFQYVLKDELDYFVVRIIDKDTDKVIREIPSRELQRVHEGIQTALGMLFDEEI
jgi:flagellar protein FlaG